MRRGENNIVRSVMEWKTLEKRPRLRPRKKWIDAVEEDQRNMRIDAWRELVQDRDRLLYWRRKLLGSYKSHKK